MANFNVNQFLHSMSGDGARPNLFRVVVNYHDNSADNELFSFRARATNLPGSQMPSIQVPYFGRTVKFAGTSQIFQDWSVTVIVDESDFGPTGPRTKLEQWMNALNTHVGNVRESNRVSPQSYQRDCVVYQYAKDGNIEENNILATYKMVGCFPTAIDPIPLDWGNNDRIMEFGVTFSMQYWEREGVTT